MNAFSVYHRGKSYSPSDRPIRLHIVICVQTYENVRFGALCILISHASSLSGKFSGNSSQSTHKYKHRKGKIQYVKTSVTDWTCLCVIGRCLKTKNLSYLFHIVDRLYRVCCLCVRRRSLRVLHRKSAGSCRVFWQFYWPISAVFVSFKVEFSICHYKGNSTRILTVVWVSKVRYIFVRNSPERWRHKREPLYIYTFIRCCGCYWPYYTRWRRLFDDDNATSV